MALDEANSPCLQKQGNVLLYLYLQILHDPLLYLSVVKNVVAYLPIHRAYVFALLLNSSHGLVYTSQYLEVHHYTDSRKWSKRYNSFPISFVLFVLSFAASSYFS